MGVSFPKFWQIGLVFEGYDDQMVAEVLASICEGIVSANMIWMERVGPQNYPCCLADADVKYIDPPGCADTHPCQVVLGAPAILRRRVATCIDIACYMAALLRLQGQFAEVIFTNTLDRRGEPEPGQYHALVQCDDGIHDYTKDLIDGDTARCSVDCFRS